MIDEVYLNEAVRIRRTYLKLSSNMDVYQKKAQEVIKTLDSTSKIDALHEEHLLRAMILMQLIYLVS
jgi:wyosine [tRNA(Phe)-imidazoG37] synthetase (radical SAM superfamily)